VPYVPDFNKWIRHFEDISAGRVRPDFKDRYIVGSGSHHRSRSPPQDENPKVKLVTAVAQAIEMAKSELNRENQEAYKVPKSIRMSQAYPLPGKRAHTTTTRGKVKKKPRLNTQLDD
jgi:hypothetical protein